MTTSFCDNYSFPDTFDLTRAIQNEKISDETLLFRLQELTTSQQLRSIIEQGIIAFCNSKKDFAMISTFSKVLKNDVSLVAADVLSHGSIKKCDQTSYEKVFAIESLICHIFTYLDLKSLLTVSNVNSQWLHDTNNTKSVSCLEMADLFSHKKVFKYLVDDEFLQECHDYETYYLMDLIDRKHRYQFQFIPRFRNLYRFANIGKITMQYWWLVMASLNKKYFQQMEQLFQKIKHIRVIDPSSKNTNRHGDLSHYCRNRWNHQDDDAKSKFDIGTKIYVELTLNIINKNASNIQTIELEGDKADQHRLNAVASIVKVVFGDCNNINYNHAQEQPIDVSMSSSDQDAQLENKMQNGELTNVTRNINIVPFQSLRKLSFAHVSICLARLNSCELPKLQHLGIIHCISNIH